ncbi:MAG: class I SAM-dependent methyltransferase [Burkholderiales bacterium]
MLDAIVSLPFDLRASSDLSFGWDVWAARIPADNWVVVQGEPLVLWLQGNSDWLSRCEGEVLLIFNPLLTVSRQALSALRRALQASDAPCVMPADVRGFGRPVAAHYATQRGLDRMAEAHGREGLPVFAFDGRAPFVLLFRPGALPQLLAASSGKWDGTPPSDTLIVPDAIVHDHSAYYLGDRAEVLALLPERIERLLDIGGGAGNFAASVKSRYGCEAHVAELNPVMAEAAKEKVDCVWQGDIFAQANLPSYDCITALDMVEHVADPESLLRKLGPLLHQDGRLVVSLPNLGHWSVVADLMEGYWDYIAVGISCRTHVRFFTLSTIRDMFEREGWSIERCEPTRVPAPEGWLDEFSASGAKLGLQVDRQSLETYAYLVAARKR